MKMEYMDILVDDEERTGRLSSFVFILFSHSVSFIFRCSLFPRS